MTDTAHTTSPFDAAESLAPVPASRDAALDDWLRYHAATALAAHAVFLHEMRSVPRDDRRGRPELGYLAALSAASTSAVVALTQEHDVAGYLYDMAPGYGANNGEDMELITATLDRLGVNPADIDPRYKTTDFRSPTQFD